jgi:hypothetical protein
MWLLINVFRTDSTEYRYKNSIALIRVRKKDMVLIIASVRERGAMSVWRGDVLRCIVHYSKATVGHAHAPSCTSLADRFQPLTAPFCKNREHTVRLRVRIHQPPNVDLKWTVSYRPKDCYVKEPFCWALRAKLLAGLNKRICFMSIRSSFVWQAKEDTHTHLRNKYKGLCLYESEHMLSAIFAERGELWVVRRLRRTVWARGTERGEEGRGWRCNS